MGSVIINLLPLILASALLPIWLIINIILLMGENGAARSAAFIGGATLTRLIQGILFGFIFGAAAGEGGGAPVITSTILLLAGIMFLIKGVKTYLKEPDPDDPPPKWMTLADSLTPGKSFLLGAGGVLVALKLWVFTLAAIGTIEEANLAPTENVIAYLIYMVGCVIFFLVLLIMYIVAPESSKSTLAKMRAWLEGNNRIITIIVTAIFGVLFLYKGITGLLG